MINFVHETIRTLSSSVLKHKKEIARLTARIKELEAVLEAAEKLLRTDNPVTHELLDLGQAVDVVQTTGAE